MQISDLLLVFPNIALSVLFWITVIPLALYLARAPAHRAIIGFGKVTHYAMRLCSHSVLMAEAKLVARNKEVLLAAGRENAERLIEREFERVDATIRKDLSEYPSLHRRVSEDITKIDEDYAQSSEVPPDPPGWVIAIEAVANIPAAHGDDTVSNILKDIHNG